MRNVRRTFWSYLTYIVLLLLTLSKLLLSHTSMPLYWMVIGFGAIVILVRLIVKPYYFEIKGTKLIINRDLFYQYSIELDDIEKFEVNPGPFSKSYIKLKNFKLGYEFNYYVVNDNDFEELRKSLADSLKN